MPPRVTRTEGAKILGRQALTVAPLAMTLMLAYVSLRYGDNSWRNTGARIAVAAAVFSVLVGFANSAAYGSLREQQPRFFLGQEPSADTAGLIRKWLVSRALLLGLTVVAMVGYLIAVFA